jgi:hypothetical protein
LRFVDEVVETPWLITDELLYSHNIDALLQGTPTAMISKRPRARKALAVPTCGSALSKLWSVPKHHDPGTPPPPSGGVSLWRIARSVRLPAWP